MMAVEGPLLAATIARLPDPKVNLAVHGVAFAIAILVEGPVIMLMTAATALVRDAHSYRRLRPLHARPQRSRHPPPVRAPRSPPSSSR